MSHSHGRYSRSRCQGGGTSFTNNYPPAPPPRAEGARAPAECLPTNAISSVLQLLRQVQRTNTRDRERDPRLYDPYLEVNYYNPARYFPSYLDFQYILSAGSKGYAAFKEMLQNGKPGNTVMLESHDLRGVDEHTMGVVFRVLRGVTYRSYTEVHFERFNLKQNRKAREVTNPIDIIHLTLFTNTRCLPALLHSDEVRPMMLDLSHLTAQTALPPGFLSGCHFLVGFTLSSYLNPTAANLLAGCSSLASVDLSPLCGVRALPSGFLSDCSNLATLDTTPLSSLLELPDGFLQGCCGLKTLDLTPLSNLTGLPNYFLKNCWGIATLDLSPLSNITTLQRSFLQGCAGLTSLDLRPLSNLTTLPGGFLIHCSGLKALDLSPLSKITKIEGGFLQGCNTLTTLDISSLLLLNSIPGGFLSGLSSLTTLTMNSQHRSLRTYLPRVNIVYA